MKHEFSVSEQMTDKVWYFIYKNQDRIGPYIDYSGYEFKGQAWLGEKHKNIYKMSKEQILQYCYNRWGSDKVYESVRLTIDEEEFMAQLEQDDFEFFNFDEEETS